MAVAKEQIRQIISGNNINSVADIYTLLKDSFKDILQELMEAELDATLGYEKNHKGDLQTDNKRNGHSTKNLKSQYGEFQIDVPRDRNGEFEPKLIPKYQRDISGIEEKVISLYARGMSTRDIHDQLQALYGIELSAEMVNKITDKILPQVKEWQSRPLNSVYPFVFMKLKTPQELYPSNLKWSPDQRPFLCLRFKSDSICTEHLSDIRHWILRH